MSISYHRKFKKSLKKQPKRIQEKFFKVFDIFLEDQCHFYLNNHALGPPLQGVRSFNVTGDVRVHYEELSDELQLLDIGTHSQLYI